MNGAKIQPHQLDTLPEPSRGCRAQGAARVLPVVEAADIWQGQYLCTVHK